MYFSRYFILALESFVWQIVILQECTKCITIREWKNSTLRKKSDLDYQRVFPDVSSLANIWNMSDDESGEEEPTSMDSILYYENICFVICSLWNKREEHINTYYSVTGWMLCVIPHLNMMFILWTFKYILPNVRYYT